MHLPIMTIIIGLAFTVIFAWLALFLGQEFLKKFGFMDEFIQDSNQMVVYRYPGLTNGEKPGMRNIVLRGQKPFSALIGFNLNIPFINYSGFDYYGKVKSGEYFIAVISTYVGKSPVAFKFLVNTDLSINRITASSTEVDQHFTPNVEYPPHWYQRLGFYS
jgi:hypothetical protein